jgi:Icc-related predicted phosphoesterase
MSELDSFIKNMTYPNFYPLLDSSVTLDGITFIGGTLFTYFPESKYSDAEKYMTDYVYYTPGKTNMRHRNTVDYLDKNITDDKKYVVVSHHMPSYSAIAPEYKNYSHNYLFANHLDSLIRRESVLAWICGHTHTSNIVGKIYINPLGYPGENIRTLKSITVTLSHVL